MEAVLAPVGVVSRFENGNGKRNNGKNGNGRRRNGGGGYAKDRVRGDPETDRDKGIIYVKIKIVPSFKCDEPPKVSVV